MPYWRPEKNRTHFTFRSRSTSVSDEVWQFFRDMRRIEQLGNQCRMIVDLVSEEFSHANRNIYSDHISRHFKGCPRPLLLFLDPDTGLQPKIPRVTHATENEVGRAWADLHAGDWLVLYQHARRKKDWVSAVSQQLRKLCDGTTVEVARSENVGNDVAFLCARKPEGYFRPAGRGPATAVRRSSQNIRQGIGSKRAALDPLG